MPVSNECVKICEMLADYSADNLGWLNRAKVAGHISACRDCEEELGALVRACSLVEELGDRVPPAGLWNGVYNKISARERTPVVARTHRFLWPVRVLAVCALLALVLATSGILHRSAPTGNLTAGAGASEYYEGHAMASADSVFADKVSLATIAALAESENSRSAEKTN